MVINQREKSLTAAAAAAWKHLKYFFVLEFNFVFKATVNLPLIQVWFSIVVLLFGDLGRREEGLPVLFVAPWSVTVPPFEEPMEDKVEVRLGHRVEHLLVPRLPCEGLLGTSGRNMQWDKKNVSWWIFFEIGRWWCVDWESKSSKSGIEGVLRK